MKKKLAEAEGAKNVAIWARDEAMRAKKEAEFARTEAECSKEKAEEEAYDAEVVETEVALKAQVPGVCILYCSQVWKEALKQVGVNASFNLWKAECVFFPLLSGKMLPPAPRYGMLQKGLRSPSPTLPRK